MNHGVVPLLGKAVRPCQAGPAAWAWGGGCHPLLGSPSFRSPVNLPLTQEPRRCGLENGQLRVLRASQAWPLFSHQTLQAGSREADPGWGPSKWGVLKAGAVEGPRAGCRPRVLRASLLRLEEAGQAPKYQCHPVNSHGVTHQGTVCRAGFSDAMGRVCWGHSPSSERQAAAWLTHQVLMNLANVSCPCKKYPF